MNVLTRHFLKGFTVLELVVVMTIIFVILGLSVPAYQSAIKGNAPLSGATQLAGDLTFARQNAVTTHNPTAVIFSTFTAATNNQISSLVSYAILQKTNDATWVYIDRWHFLPKGAFLSKLPAAPAVATPNFPFPTNDAALLPITYTNYVQFESTGETTPNATYAVMQGLVRKNSAGTVMVVNSNLFNVVTGVVYRTTGFTKIVQ